MARNPKAEVEITAESRTLGAKLREARAKFARFGSELKKHVFGKDLVEKGFFGRAGAQMVGNLGSQAVSSLGSLLADQGRDVFEFNDQLKRLQITASRTPEEMDAFGQSIRKTSSDFGVNARLIQAGAQAYVALTGDIDGATASSRTWARVAQATNSQVADISETAAALKQQMNIKPGEMEATFSALAAQGKAGAIELKDLAAQLSSIAPQWAEFKGGKGVQGVKELGAALQIVKRGFGGDASETVTGLQSLLNALIKNAARFKAAKINIFDKDPKTGQKTLRNVLDIVKSIGESKLAKDPTKLEKAMGRVEAYRAYLQLKNNRDELEKMITVAGDAGLIQRDLDTYLQSSAGRTKIAIEGAKNAIAEAFTPERIEAFVHAIEQLAQKLGPIVEGVMKIGAVLGLPFKLGQKIRGAISGANNPFDADHQAVRTISTLAPFENRQDFDPRLKAQLGIARARLANSKSYERTVEDIMGGEVDGGVSKESIQRAVLAKLAPGNAPGGLGQQIAGERYLRAAKVTDAAAQEVYAKAFGEALKPLIDELKRQGAEMAKNQPITVKADGKAIVDVHRGSSAHARRPGG